jgi:hypothetical protein
MARPRRYTTDTERRQAHAQSQRSYRRRQDAATLPVDRAALAALVAAVDAAATAGDTVAQRVRTATTDGLLRNLAQPFPPPGDGARHPSSGLGASSPRDVGSPPGGAPAGRVTSGRRSVAVVERRLARQATIASATGTLPCIPS